MSERDETAGGHRVGLTIDEASHSSLFEVDTIMVVEDCDRLSRLIRKTTCHWQQACTCA